MHLVLLRECSGAEELDLGLSETSQLLNVSCDGDSRWGKLQSANSIGTLGSLLSIKQVQVLAPDILPHLDS